MRRLGAGRHATIKAERVSCSGCEFGTTRIGGFRNPSGRSSWRGTGCDP
ncbi:hypothetical protein IAQ67_12400 [Paenibacillus peoriae]|uniref:Uncharacterized protein n=1 Tax=Paenibacillus peoriae TaxID=59893 RepID=A0A7H0YF73_9BACL|nr:hypothetical protein [Paenibacillus peoriae]QNR69731.1 hypothetical protein IAQ67_12400 [Paenibacillus peoriae]